ncbi:nuclease-related domain-containing protein [Erysipelothrix rhusiopathiae]|uniref:nuclease-related domain-containing protein n=1 Tax=Erysipelothrix rhusiopathiae TaxID=1648 RepID=UPI000F4304D2|nr:nuclease-related domain-containing protein [Erysipelothrix rhusiopathiae]AYV34713.1 NERD domain-containing protein [Erysipelothrix rhusiopathiae]MDE8081322.1 nuclease-related domain-containing protein [Erysipelothrix rhusiopathiae]MDE8314627.1 nuclease-related domain-containing protein [Erysipelothrix rhusiopathiae]MDE8333649.1 nuclease-related domain-containing protein [Erysipelothrix rhusiopathiae]
MKSIRYRIYQHKTRKKNAKDRGTQFELEAFNLLSQDSSTYVYHSTYIPIVRNNGITEIDLIVVNRSGIACFEVKYTKQPFIGSYDDAFWFKKGTDQSIRNPFIQNRYHVDALASYLGIDASFIKNCVLVNHIDRPIKNLFTLSSAHSYSNVESLSRSEITRINRLLLRRQRFLILKKWKHRRYRKKIAKKNRTTC